MELLMVDLDLLVRLLGLVSLVKGYVFLLLGLKVTDIVEDFDYLAYTAFVLCVGRNGVFVILFDIDIMGKHVLGSQYPIPCQPVSLHLVR
jgi:hypothetical protein